MTRIDILNKILKELENISSERPGDFIGGLDGYADDYDGDNLGAFMSGRNLDSASFEKTFHLRLNYMLK